MNRKASLSVIFVTVFIDLLGFGLLIPILPTFAGKELNISDFEIGIIIASFSLMQFFFNPIIGKISDRIGRRPVILFTMSLTFISYIIFSYSTSFTILLISRIIAGLGGSNIAAAQAYIADITDKANRSKGMGIIGAAFGLGFVFGPFMGGMISKISYEAVGFSAAAFTLTALIFAIFYLPESIKEKQTGKFEYKLIDISYVKYVFKIPNLGFVIFIFFVIIFSIANIYGMFAILGFKVFHFSNQQIAYLYSIIGVVGAIIQGVLVRYFTKWFSDKKLLLIGTFFMAIGLGALPYGGTFVSVVIITIIIALGTGILQPVLLSVVSKFAPDGEQGAILGVNQSLAALARVLGPLWGGFAFEYINYHFPFLTGATFTLLTIVLIYFYFKETK